MSASAGRFTETMRALGAAVAGAMHRGDLKIALGMVLWARNFHMPKPVEDRAVCLRCKVDWPCDEFDRLDDRVTDLRERVEA